MLVAIEQDLRCGPKGWSEKDQKAVAIKGDNNRVLRQFCDDGQM